MSTWGVVALVCGTLAVLGVNVAAVVPAQWMAGLHASRMEGTSLVQLRERIARLETEAAGLRRANEEIATRASLTEQSASDMARRVDVLETALPAIVEASRAPALDRDAITASTAAPATVPPAETDSNFVVRRVPLLAPPPSLVPPDQALPAPLALATITDHGIVLGSPVRPAEALDAWRALAAEAGTLLVGLDPMIEPGEGERRIVAGPLGSAARAEDLCRRLIARQIACAPLAFDRGRLVPLP